MFEIRDPIHGTIEFTEREKKVIDHPCVQRLRYIRQLGMTFLVYPGSGHDRFSHAVGAMHLAGGVWRRINETSGKLLREYLDQKELKYLHEILRFSALLHDVGHPPFSHVSEKFMPLFGQLKIPFSWFKGRDKKSQATHEDYSVMLIAFMASGSEPIFDLEEAQDIASLVHHNVAPSKRWLKKFGSSEGRAGIHALLRSLISGELDVDRMDYLLRDAHHTGVTYGYHDLEHLIGNLGVTLGDKKELALTIDATAVRAFEDFLLARYHMFLQVYLHKTTLSFDYFLEKAMNTGELGISIPKDSIGYLRLRDSTIIEKAFDAAEESSGGSWSKRLVMRRPAKLVLSAAQADGKKLIKKLTESFGKNKINYFIVTARQRLSKSWVKNKEHSSSLLVRRKLFGNFLFEPIEKYSSLLKHYNQTIDLTNLYVLPEDWSKAKKILSKVKLPLARNL